MKLQVKNIQYFEWEVPEKLYKDVNITIHDNLQQLIDECFISDDLSVEQISDDYYELEEINYENYI